MLGAQACGAREGVTRSSVVEHGVHGRRAPRRVGRYSYRKRLKGGLPVPTDVDVFAIEIAKLYDSYPEAGQRERRWVTPAEASQMVDEPDLKALLADAEALVTAPARK